VTSIEPNAFEACESLMSVSIPSSMTSIAYRAFDDCTSLESAYYDGSEAQWESISIDWGNDALTSTKMHFKTASITGSFSGTKLAWSVQNAPSGAWVIAARYNGGRMTCVQIKAGDSAKPWFEMAGSGTEYRLMLVNAGFVPLCPAWSSKG